MSDAALSEDEAVDAFKAIGHPSRLRILDLLKAGERNVGEIEAATGIGQPALSQQLGVLRKAGLVETRKEAKLVFYRRDEERLANLADMLGATPGRTPEPAATRKPAPGAANFARLS